MFFVNNVFNCQHSLSRSNQLATDRFYLSRTDNNRKWLMHIPCRPFTEMAYLHVFAKSCKTHSACKEFPSKRTIKKVLICMHELDFPSISYHVRHPPERWQLHYLSEVPFPEHASSILGLICLIIFYCTSQVSNYLHQVGQVGISARRQ